MAGELAMCRTSGRSPARSAYGQHLAEDGQLGGDGGVARARRRRRSATRAPVTFTAPSASAARAAATSSGQSAGWQPLRPEPGVGLELDAGGAAGRRAAAAVTSAQRPQRADRRRRCPASMASPPGAARRPQPAHAAGPVSPAARSASASSGVAVPSQLAPASRRGAGARAPPRVRTPSDLTTAISSARGARARSARTLARSGGQVDLGAGAHRAVWSCPSVAGDAQCLRGTGGHTGLTRRACAPRRTRCRPS